MEVVSETKVTASLWGMCDETIVAATNKGEVRIYDTKVGGLVMARRPGCASDSQGLRLEFAACFLIQHTTLLPFSLAPCIAALSSASASVFRPTRL